MAKGFKMPGNMQGMLKQAQKMQEDLQRVQQEVKASTMDGSAGGGMVKVSINGEHQMLSIDINPEVVNAEDIEMLQDLILAAVNDATSKLQVKMKSAMEGATGGMNLPGMF